MKIILDTNVWYDLFDNGNLLNNVNQSLVQTTFLNYFEIIKKKAIVTNPERSRWLFHKMDEFEKLFEPPFVYIAKQHEFFHYNSIVKLQDYIFFLVSYKNGDYIDKEKTEEFYNYINFINSDFENLSISYNIEAKKIKAQIKNNKIHLEKDSQSYIKEYVVYLVRLALDMDISTMDFTKIELLIRTLDIFFKRLEVGQLKATTNDIVDFLILSYVQPGDQFVTNDKKWKKLITDAGCSKYLLDIY